MRNSLFHFQKVSNFDSGRQNARAAGVAFSRNQDALTGTLDDMKQGVRESGSQGVRDTLALAPCKSLVTSVKKEVHGEATSVAREAEEEASYARKVGAYLAKQVSEKWRQKARGSLVKLAEDLFRVL